MKRDELNVLAENYYSVMDIDEEQKKKREEDAWDLFELFMLLFYYFKEAQNNEVEDYSFILPRFQIDLQEVVSNITAVDDYLINYFAILALAVYTTTLEHLGSEYYLSDDRAANLALNESNTINNYLDVKEAQNEGYTHKKWVAELDERTRPEHIMMDGTIVPIDGYFEFSDCKMFAPHDVVNGTAAQNANCRCWLEYLNYEEREYGIRYGKYSVNNTADFLHDLDYLRKYNELGYSKEVTDKIIEYSSKAIMDNIGTKLESIYILNTQDGSLIASIDGDDRKEQGVSYTPEFIAALDKAISDDLPIMAIHNHPEGYPPSPDDFKKAFDNNYVDAIAVGFNEQIYRYSNRYIALTDQNCDDITTLIAQNGTLGFDPDKCYRDVYNQIGLQYTILKGEQPNE